VIATQLRCGGISSNYVIADLVQNVLPAAKKF